jgi:hypothetical protein
MDVQPTLCVRGAIVTFWPFVVRSLLIVALLGGVYRGSRVALVVILALICINVELAEFFRKPRR